MLSRLVKCDGAIELRPASRDIPCRRQGNAHCAMRNHEWDCRPLPLGCCEELCRELAQNVAIERQVVRNPEAVKDRDQQQRVFERLAKAFCLFDQQICSLHGTLGFRRRVSLDMDEWSY